MKKARSLRRKEAKKVRKQQQRQRVERWNKTKKWVIWTIPASLAVLGALASAATLHGYYKSRLSILAGTSSINSNGFQMPIKVSNDGILSVNDVAFSCVYRKAVASNGAEFGNVKITGFPTQNIAEIAPGHPVTLLCQGRGLEAMEITAPLNYIDLEITVSFRPSFYLWQKSDTFKLIGVRGPDGTFQWMPH